jgi:hypothetical protein
LTYSPAVDSEVGVAIWLVSASVGDRSGGTSRPTLATFALLSVKRNICRQSLKHTDEVSYSSLSAKSHHISARSIIQTLVVGPHSLELAASTVGVGGVALTVGPVAAEGSRLATDQKPRIRSNVRVVEASRGSDRGTCGAFGQDARVADVNVGRRCDRRNGGAGQDEGL